MNPYQLTGKHILITGASSGIGAETARRIADVGGKVILTARNKERLQQVKSDLKGDGHRIIPADLTDEAARNELINQIDELDGIVISSGIVRPFPIKFISAKQIDQLFDINYNAPVSFIARLFRKKKISHGASLVFMSSVSSRFPHKGGALYAGTKAALNSYSKTIALEYAPKKIRSNVISAAMVKTPLFDEAEKAISKEMMDKHRESYPLGFGESEDIAHAIVFLLSNASRWITGTEIVMDGGLTAGQ